MGPSPSVGDDGALHLSWRRWDLPLGLETMGPSTSVGDDGAFHLGWRRWGLPLQLEMMGPSTWVGDDGALPLGWRRWGLPLGLETMGPSTSVGDDGALPLGWRRWGLPLELGVCLPPRNTLRPHTCYCTKFCRSRKDSRAQVGTQNIGEAGRQALSVVETSSSRSCEVNSW